MPRAIIGAGTLVDPDGKPAARLRVHLQARTPTGDWKTIASSQTGTKGEFRIKASGAQLRGLTGTPRMRLTGGRGDILSENPSVSVARNNMGLDFGQIKRGAGGDSGSLTKRLVKAEHGLRALKVENKALLQRALDAEKVRALVERKRDDLAAGIAERDARLHELEAQLEKTASPQFGTLDDTVAQEMTRLKVRLLNSEIELQTRTARTDTLVSHVDGLTSERDALKLELEQLRNSEEAAPQIGMLATTIAESLRGIETQGVEFADARITLKGYLADAGQRFKPLDAAELSRINPDVASEISFGVRPRSPAAGGDSQAMPDVVGLTPASASRVLRPLGRRIEIVETVGKPVGAVIAQNPAAKGDLRRDATIRLMVATETNKEN